MLVLVALLGSPPINADTKAGNKLLKKGREAESRHDFDAALSDFEQASESDPSEVVYKIATIRARREASTLHLQRGKQLREEGKLNDAMIEFKMAVVRDPASIIAYQLIDETKNMLNQQSVMPSIIVSTPEQAATERKQQRIADLEQPATLKPQRGELTFTFNNISIQTIYRGLGQLSGINVVFQAHPPEPIDELGPKYNYEMHSVSLEEALNHLARTTHTMWKPVSANTIFVYCATEQSRALYEDEVVRVFYLHNVRNAADLAEILAVVRGTTKLASVTSVVACNAIVARGTVHTMALIEKILHDLDVSKGEVALDFTLMEVSRSRILTLGNSLTGGGLSVPVVFGPGSSTAGNVGGASGSTASTSSTAPTIAQSGTLSAGSISVTLPGLLVQAIMDDSTTKILQRPSIQVSDGGKSSLKLGSKIPYVSGSLSSVSTGTVPYATTQFQQVDVGINIDASPRITGDNSISMHLRVEISQVTSTESIAGITEPIISQRINEADVEMRDGQVSLLGGLVEESNTQVVAGIPGLALIPGLGNLFGTKSKNHETDDIIMAVVPRILRHPGYGNDDREVLAGTKTADEVRTVKHEKDMTTPGSKPNRSDPSPAARPATTSEPRL